VRSVRSSSADERLTRAAPRRRAYRGQPGTLDRIALRGPTRGAGRARPRCSL